MERAIDLVREMRRPPQTLVRRESQGHSGIGPMQRIRLGGLLLYAAANAAAAGLKPADASATAQTHQPVSYNRLFPTARHGGGFAFPTALLETTADMPASVRAP